MHEVKEIIGVTLTVRKYDGEMNLLEEGPELERRLGVANGNYEFVFTQAKNMVTSALKRMVDDDS